MTLFLAQATTADMSIYFLFVKEKQHKERIKELFPAAYTKKEFIVLNFAGAFAKMNPELIEMLTLPFSDFL